MPQPTPSSSSSPRTAAPSDIAVIGVGAVGAVVAEALLQRHPQTRLCVRRPFSSLVVDSASGRSERPARVETDPARAAPARWVLLATKAHQTDGAGDWLRALTAADEATVVVLQNGIEHVERVQPLVARARVLPAVVHCPATARAPGHVERRGEARLEVPAGEDGEAFAALFDGTSVDVSVASDFVTAAWRKLCHNAVAGGLMALTDRGGDVFGTPAMQRLAHAALLECIAVARADGAKLAPADADDLVARLVASPRALPSIVADRRAGRPLEHDARNGVISRRARMHRLETPICDTLATLLAALG